MSGYQAELPHVAADPNGNAIAVWMQSDGTARSVYANHYVPGTGWGNARLVENKAGDVYYPHVAMDANGNAMAVWHQHEGSDTSSATGVYASRYDAGTDTWQAPQLIDNVSGWAYRTQVAMDPNGNAIAVWDQDGGSTYNVYANRFDATSGTWGSAQEIENSSLSYAVMPHVAMDANGNAIAVWFNGDGSSYDIYANRYVYGSGWGASPTLLDSGVGSATSPRVAMDPAGNAMAVWRQDDGSTYYRTFTNRYVLGTGWTGDTMIQPASGDVNYPDVASDPNGNFVAIWWQNDGSAYNIYANRYVSGTGWGSEVLLGDGMVETYPKVALDSSGNAIAVWSQDNGSYNQIATRRFVPGTGWGTAQVLSTGSDAINPSVAVDPAGHGFAVWGQFMGSTVWVILSNEYR
jgi:hypothetical protein